MTGCIPPSAFRPANSAFLVIGGKFTVTNIISGPARFYGLRKP